MTQWLTLDFILLFFISGVSLFIFLCSNRIDNFFSCSISTGNAHLHCAFADELCHRRDVRRLLSVAVLDLLLSMFEENWNDYDYDGERWLLTSLLLKFILKWNIIKRGLSERDSCVFVKLICAGLCVTTVIRVFVEIKKIFFTCIFEYMYCIKYLFQIFKCTFLYHRQTQKPNWVSWHLYMYTLVL